MRPAPLFIAILLLGAGLPEAEAAPDTTSPLTPSSALPPVPLATPVTTDHAGTFNGRRMRYRAVVEGFDVANADGSRAGRIAAISYTASSPAPDRPVLFVFNGGPISPSAILHMGAFGPKRVAIPDDITAPPSSFRLVDNPYSPLDVADIVFFDPAGTGFSRFAPGSEPAAQFSVAADARQLEQLVLAWTKAHHRETSPIYLVGESYGTLRAPEAARQLADAGRAPAGLILLGQAVNIIEYAQRRRNIVSYAVSLPTMAAIAWWHERAERRGRTFERFIRDAQDFGGGEYLSALFLGNRAAPDRRRAVAVRLQEFTGISADYWLSHALRMTKVEYQRALLPGKVLATNDGRYAGSPSEPSPFDAIPTCYAAQFRRYLLVDLRIPFAADYADASPFTGGLNDWRWGANRSPFGDWPYDQAIGDLFAAQPNFRLFVANGYYDTQTTIGAMDLLLDQSGWPRNQVLSAYYQGGHMPYTIEASLKALTSDIRAMVTRQW